MKDPLQLRKEPHPVSSRPALIGGRESREVFVTLRTRNCAWGRCKFCGLGQLDGDKPPLLFEEAAAQIRGSLRSFVKQGGDLRNVGKVSLIANSEGLLSPRIIGDFALVRILEIIREKIPEIAEIGIENRADMFDPKRLTEIGSYLDRLFANPPLVREVVMGIESPYEHTRREARKGISNNDLFRAFDWLSRTGWNLRGYFIHNLFEHTSDDRVKSLLDTVEFMSQVQKEYGMGASILMLTGYVPMHLSATPLFAGFTELPPEISLAELRQAALAAREKRVRFEIDTTTADQENTGAQSMNSAYVRAVIRYNTTLDPEQLHL